jgi:hypothetical protein
VNSSYIIAISMSVCELDSRQQISPFASFFLPPSRVRAYSCLQLYSLWARCVLYIIRLYISIDVLSLYIYAALCTHSSICIHVEVTK